MTSFLTVILVALAGPALLWLGAWSRRGSHAVVTTQLRYQAVAVPFAVGVWLLVRLLVPDHGSVSLVGDLAAPVQGLGWMGVGDGDQWSTLLLTTGSFIVVVTAVVVWLQIGR